MLASVYLSRVIRIFLIGFLNNSFERGLTEGINPFSGSDRRGRWNAALGGFCRLTTLQKICLGLSDLRHDHSEYEIGSCTRTGIPHS